MTLEARADLPAVALSAVLAKQFGGAVEIVDGERLSAGASRQTWTFRAVGPAGDPIDLVLQRERPGGMRASTGMAVEAALLRAAAAAGVAVPELLVADGDPGTDDADLGGPWLVTRRVMGETIPRRILRDGQWASARGRLAAQCGQALAGIHRIPVGAVPGLDDTDPVTAHRNLLDQLGQPHPAFELGLRWLDANRPSSRAHAVVHGDFRNGNLVVDEDGLAAVLDWELAHRGDPVEDLAWLCLRAWRFGAPRPVGGFGERKELLAAYEAAGGAFVEPERLHWWEVMGTLRWGVICIVQTTAHRGGLSRSVELAAIGRRVCETEHDLLELLP